MTTKLDKVALFAGAAVLALGMGASDSYADKHATVVNSGNDKISLKINGQFSRNVSYVDDGRNSRIRHSDSNQSSSRFRLLGSGKINADLSVNTRAEIAIDDARNTIDSADSAFAGRSGNDLRTRKTEIWFTHKNLGRVWFGAGDGAANGVMNTSHHGMYGFLPTGAGIWANTSFVNATTRANTGVTFANDGGDFDAQGRRPRLRYDTPVIAGFMATVGHNDQQSVEASLRYSGKFLDTGIKADFGYVDCSAAAGSGCVAAGEWMGGGVSLGHSSGFGGNMHIGYNDQEDTAQDPWLWTAQLHYGSKFSELGKTTIGGEYQYSEDHDVEGAVVHTWSAIVEQKIDAAAMDVFLRWGQSELELDGVSVLDDINIVTLGTRVKF